MIPAIDRHLVKRGAIAAFLIAAVYAAYWEVLWHDFIEYDDQSYVLENPLLRSGFTLKNIKWAFTAVYAANWHPVTWLSHLLDVRLFGMEPFGHHIVNVLLHALNSALLFLLFCRVTGAVWRSSAVAALFALHPLHVESVAWVAERKDVLSTLFMYLSLLLYAGYVQRPRFSLYALIAGTFALGLMSKPMLVTVPLVMLLLDYWPFRRFTEKTGSSPLFKRPLVRLIAEKIPLLLMAAASSMMTLSAQKSGAAMTTLTNSPLPERLANAVTAYVTYLRKTVWPHDLAIFYPFPDSIDLWPTAGAAAILVAITLLSVRLRQRHPYLLVGWLWYLVTLVPVIGVVRVGLQSMADRYTYIPLTGIFLMTVWGAADLTAGSKWRSKTLAGCTAVLLSACLIVTRQQVSYWKNTTTVATRALAVTRDNYIAHCILGRQLEKDGKLEEALFQFEEALRIAPWYEYAKVHQGLLLQNQGRVDAAIFKYNEVILQNPTSVSGHINLGILLSLQGKLQEAIQNFDIALKFNPGSSTAHYNMGLTLSRIGKTEQAVDHYFRALEIDPYNIECHNNIGIVLADQGKLDEAIAHFSEAIRIKPDFFDARNNLQLALQKKKQSH